MRVVILCTVRGGANERKLLKTCAAKAGLSLNEFVRKCVGLPPWSREVRDNQGREARDGTKLLAAQGSGDGSLLSG
jgi:hypothetical protein